MKWLIATIIALMSSAAVAGDAQKVETPAPPVRFYKDTSGYHIATRDGREVTIFEYIRSPKEISIHLKQIENTCIPDQELADCTFHLDFAPVHYLFIWTKHNDPAKVGSLVSPELGKLSSPLGSYETRAVQDLKTLYKPDRLTCSNYAWTNGMQKTKTGAFIADSWSGELMLPNDETGINENQTFSNGFEIELQPASHNELEVVNVKSDYHSSVFLAYAPYLSNQVSNLIFKSTKSEICQVSFESSLGNANAVLGSPYFAEIDFKNIKPTMIIIPALYMQLKSRIESHLLELSNNGGMQ